MRTDFQLENNDLKIKDGDFRFFESDDQHIQHILESVPGDFKQFELLGVGIRLELNGLMDGEVKRRIQLHLESDDYLLEKLIAKGEELTVKYETNYG